MVKLITNGVKTVSSRVRPATSDEEIVISGISGKFPSSKNVLELATNLYNKVDMMCATEKRWPDYNPEIPARMGVIDDIEKFDATFFGVPYKQANSMDPQGRLLIETAYEAVLDAGVCPKSIRGSKTGVYIGAFNCESERAFLYHSADITGAGIVGCSRAMLANRVSYCLGLTGPSVALDTACSSSMYALDAAFSAIRSGECDAALVGGSNLLLHPHTTLEFIRTGTLAKDGFCRPFDEKASGYTRAEAICVIYLQRTKDAKRIYANLIYSKTSCDGYKMEGITYPSGEMQRTLLDGFYKDIHLDPTTIGYVEAHSTGTMVGDPEECKALDNIYCQGRSEPLLVGSLKSNIGHTESSSGVCSIAKAIITFESGKVPPNINFDEIKTSIPALTEKRMVVCTESTPLRGDKIAINSFGFGGANAHALFSMNPKSKIHGGVPLDNIPRLVNWAGRTEEAVETMLNALESQPLDAEYVALLHSAQSEEVQGNLHCGYTILTKESSGDNGTSNALCLSRAMNPVDGNKRPVVWLFSGIGSQWLTMGKELMIFAQFYETVEFCHTILKPFGLDLMSILTSDDPKTFNYIVNSYIGITCTQIGLVNLLRLLDVKMDYCIGHSLGELGVAYADGTLTAKQTILAAYARGIASSETKVIEGSMAAVGLGYEKVVDMLPPSIEAACHNSNISTTISGPKADVAKFVEELRFNGIFTKEVQCSNIPFHSRYIAEMGPKLLKTLRKIIPRPVKRSKKWISTSVPSLELDLEQNTFSSAEYFTNNLLKPVLFEEAVNLLPSKSIVIEIAPHGLLQAIIKKSMPQAVHIPLTHRGHDNNAVFFLNALGKMFLNGLTLPIERLYPAVEFPVSRGTPMISPLIKWDHTEDCFVMKFSAQKGDHSNEWKTNISLDVDSYITGHVIDGNIIVPGTFYLQLVWNTLSMMTFGVITTTSNIEFENVRFLRATTIAPGQNVEFNTAINGSGQFEVTDNGDIVVSGIVRFIETTYAENGITETDEFDSSSNVLEKDDFYKELRLRGYQYENLFQGVEKIRFDAQKGIIKWNDNWPAFIDAMLQINILARDTRSLYLPTRIRKVRINTAKQMTMLNNAANQKGELIASYDPYLKTVKCGGVEIYDLTVDAVARRKHPGIEVLEEYRFLPLVPKEKLTLTNAVDVVIQLINENRITSLNLKVIEIDSLDETPIIKVFEEVMTKTLLVKSDLQLLTERDVSLDNITTLKGKPGSNLKGFNLIIAMDNATTEMKKVLKSVAEDSYMLIRHNRNVAYTDVPSDFNMITTISTENETLVLFQRKSVSKPTKEETIIEIISSDLNYKWLERLKSSIKLGPVLLYTQNDPTPGLLGLVNCLRREPGVENVRCVIMMDQLSSKFSMDNNFYTSQLDLGLAVNVCRNSVWGTYRFFELKPDLPKISRLGHAYANVQRIGDLSSISWINGPLKLTVDKLVNVHYSSINFKDLMLATGRLSTESCHASRLDGDCVLGIEFSGINSSGERVMGMVNVGATATQVKPVEYYTWTVPKDWSLRDGATIPVAYITVYYAFFFGKCIKPGNSILIHAGSGGVGLAAIRIALAYGLEVFTTVSTQKKRKFILGVFPQLKEENIGNSRDCSFEHLVMHRTKGRGVDYVLNSLSDEMLLASVRCLARYGTFLEIGKFDIMNNSALGMSEFDRDITFRALFIDHLYDMPEMRKIIYELIDKDLKSGVIQPLPSTVFHVSEMEQAYRFMSTGKHIGKLMIQIRENVPAQSFASVPIKVSPKMYYKPDLVYIVSGGLGGFGLELCDWLIIRGARILVLNSRRGVSTSYQAYRISLWKSYGCKIIINTADIGTYQGAKNLFAESRTHGHIGGVFNLAAVLRDNILENQTVEKYQECIRPKANATQYFDELSRTFCPKLEHFVIFSSASCGKGNPGQTNYGMANGIMERIIEQRLQKNLPGKAIQYGAVGDVGLIAEKTIGRTDFELLGTLQQPIASCLNALDTLLTSPQAIVSSIVVTDKRNGAAGQAAQLTPIQRVMKILGIRDIKAISKNASLSELGMDSLMVVEIKQIMECDYNVVLTPKELRAMTVMKLEELSNPEILAK